MIFTSFSVRKEPFVKTYLSNKASPPFKENLSPKLSQSKDPSDPHQKFQCKMRLRLSMILTSAKWHAGTLQKWLQLYWTVESAALWCLVAPSGGSSLLPHPTPQLSSPPKRTNSWSGLRAFY